MKARNAYQQARVWRLLKDHGRLPVREIARRLRLDDKCLSTMLGRMRRGGFVAVEGRTHRAEWRACGSHPPEDSRGLPPGSVRNIAPNQRRWLDLLYLANAANGRPDKNITLSGRFADPLGVKRTGDSNRVRPATALEQAWGWGVQIPRAPG